MFLHFFTSVVLLCFHYFFVSAVSLSIPAIKISFCFALQMCLHPVQVNQSFHLVVTRVAVTLTRAWKVSQYIQHASQMNPSVGDPVAKPFLRTYRADY